MQGCVKKINTIRRKMMPIEIICSKGNEFEGSYRKSGGDAAYQDYILKDDST